MTEYEDLYEKTGKGRQGARGRLVAGMAAAGLVGALAVGGGLFFASHAGAGGPGHGAWCAAGDHGGCGHGPWFGHGRFHHERDPEAVRERIGFVSDHILGYVDASEEQRQAIDGILDRSVTQTLALVGEREGVHEQLTALLSGPEIDREALEALRAQQIELADAVSRQLTTSMAEIADVLTPEQRAELAELHTRFRR